MRLGFFPVDWGLQLNVENKQHEATDTSVLVALKFNCYAVCCVSPITADKR